MLITLLVLQRYIFEGYIYTSRLSNGVTWAIKKIEEKHICRALEIYNHVCNVTWARKKLMDDSRANPNIPENALNELLFWRYGVYMKPASLCMTKNDVFDKILGGHDESYKHLSTYSKIIYENNP